jgi:hypothetical protein
MRAFLLARLEHPNIKSTRMDYSPGNKRGVHEFKLITDG